MTNKMEKIKNFNQILLSIAGVIGIAFIIAVCTLLIIDFWPRHHTEEGMIAEEEVEVLNEKGLRKEIISFDDFQVVDSAEQIFVLPVTQASLDNPERSDKSLGLINEFSGRGYYDELVYNNIAIHYGKIDSTIIAFRNRLSIGNYIISKNKKLLFVSGCTQDSNDDKFLNSKDLQNLYVYNIQTRKTQEIETPPNHTLIYIYEPNKTNMILCQFGIDRNENGKFEESIEPTVFMKLDQEKLTLMPFVDENNILVLQNILEGK